MPRSHHTHRTRSSQSAIRTRAVLSRATISGAGISPAIISPVVESLENRQLFSTYYANAQASTSGTGSADSPWNSLSSISAYTAFQPGDVVKLSGTFTNQTLTLGTPATGITLTSADTANPAVIAESANFSFYDAIQVTTSGVTISYLNLTGPGITASSNSNDGIDFLNTTSTQMVGATLNYVSATGFVFAGANFQGNTSGFTNVTVTNSTFDSNQVSGLVVTGTDIKIINGTGVLRQEIFPNLLISNVTASDNAGAAIYFNANDLGPTQSSNNGGIYVSQVNGGTITHCTAIGNCYNSYGACAIWAHDSDGLNIEYSEAADTRTTRRGFDGNGFDFDHDVNNSIMQYDYSHGNDGIGLYLCSFSGATNCNNDTIRYNITDDDGRNANFAIRIYGQPGHYVTNANIYNNTILATDGSEIGFGIDGSSTGASGCTVNFLNNVICTANDSEAVEFPNGAPSLTNVKMEGNDYWVTGYGTNTFKLIWGSTTYQSFNDFVTGTGEETLNGNTVGLNVDPLLNNETVSDLPIGFVNNFALSSSSPLRHAGLILTGPPFSNSAPYSNDAPFNLAGSAWGGIGTQDYFGNPLGQSTTHDIGADTTLTTLVLNGNSSTSVMTVQNDSSATNTIDVNGTAYPAVNAITISGSTSNQTVVADLSNGLFNLTFNGGTGANSLIVQNPTGTASPASSITFNPKGTSNNLNISAGKVTIPANTQNSFRQAIFSNITIATASQLVLAAPPAPASRTLVVIDGTLSVNGTLDLGGNDLDLPSGNLLAIDNMIRAGFNTAPANAILTSTSSTNIALAAIPNTVDGSTTGTALFNTFDGMPVLNTDILVKSTYNGDANLDGTVDSTDYARVDSGFITQSTGWNNGDFNYDGVINGSDYTLIDNAFNSHAASLATQITSHPAALIPQTTNQTINQSIKSTFVPPTASQYTNSDPTPWLHKRKPTATPLTI